MAESEQDITVEREDWAADVGPFLDWMTEQYPHFDTIWLRKHDPSLIDSIWEALAKLGRMEDVAMGELIAHLRHLQQLVCQADAFTRAELARYKEL